MREPGLEELSRRYPVWFCDVWGVIHNGVRKFAAAEDALARHRRNGGHVILVTNAPRRGEMIARQFARLGITAAAFDHIVTSGEVTVDLVRRHAGQGIHYIGPQRDRGILDGIDVRLVPVAEAAAVLCTGLVDDERESPDDYRESLAAIRARDLGLICANPDRIVRRGERLVYCAGALAEVYAQMGGAVQMAGKPYAPIYALAMAVAARLAGRTVEKSQVLAIGDGPETDIRGAADNGFDVLLIGGGVSDQAQPMAELKAEVQAACPHASIVATQKELHWADA